MTTTQERTDEPMTFEKVWAALMETRQRQEETDRQMKETDRQMKETDRQMKETDKKIGRLGNRFGEVVEYLVAPNLVDKFKTFGYSFNQTCQNEEITDREHGIFAEVDITLRNSECVMIVEAKVKPKIGDVDAHIERMGKLRAYADLHDDKKKYYGAMAGVVMSEGVKAYILKHGFYAIEPSGESFTITEPRGDVAVKVW
jgi:hypothetical protein